MGWSHVAAVRSRALSANNTAHTYPVPVLARWSDTAQLPAFHRGKAVLQASATICGTLAGSSGCESDTTAWQTITFW